MEVFRKKIKARINIGAGLLIIGAALITASLVLGEQAYDGLDVPVFSASFLHGVICGFMLVAVFFIIRYSAALRDDEKLKKLYIQETDERTLLIHQKSGSIGMNLSVIGLLVGAFVSAYFNVYVFITLLCACLFVLLIRVSMKLYYHKKY